MSAVRSRIGTALRWKNGSSREGRCLLVFDGDFLLRGVSSAWASAALAYIEAVGEGNRERVRSYTGRGDSGGEEVWGPSAFEEGRGLAGGREGGLYGGLNLGG